MFFLARRNFSARRVFSMSSNKRIIEKLKDSYDIDDDGMYEDEEDEDEKPRQVKFAGKYPEFSTLRTLSKSLRVESEKLLKDVGFRQSRSIYCTYSPLYASEYFSHESVLNDAYNTSKKKKTKKKKTAANHRSKHYEFSSISDVIMPFHVCQYIAQKHDKYLEFQESEPQINWEKFEELMSKRGDKKVDLHEMRPPVVVLLGHFNHGKTTLLDTLIGKGSKIVAKEAFGITQEIRACSLPISQKSGKSKNSTFITVIDTPGQDIFYGMRSGGAEVADAAILMISAVDGIAQQTEECIGCLQDLKIPVVAAINKIDLADEKQIESVSNSLREYEGFDNVPIVELSALTGKGVDSLKKELISIFEENGIAPLDVLAQLEGHATVLDLVNNQSGQHFLILMNTGKITVGDYFVCEFMQGRIRSIHDPLTFATKKEGLPGMAIRVQCTGINRKMDLPLGANFYITSKKKAENASIVRNLKKMLNERMIDSVPKRLNVPDSHSDGEDAFDSLYGNKVISEEVSGLIATLGDPEEQAAEGKNPLYDEIDPTTYLVIKANMGNTLSTLLDAVDDIKENGEDMSVLRSGVGAVGIGDVQNAQAAGCPIFAYNVPVDKRAKKLANKEKVEIIHSKTVQDVIDAIKSWKEKHALKLAGKLNDSDLALQEEFKDSDSESDEE